MDSLPLGFRMAQVLGLTGAAWLSGNIAALSLIAIPGVVKSYHEDKLPASTVARQWQRIYNAGKTQNPPIAAVTASAFLYLAWSVRSGKHVIGPMAPSISAMYVASTLMVIGIIPFTFLFMPATNNALISIARMDADGAEKSGSEIMSLAHKWNILNAVRSLFPLAGGIIGITAALL